ncbi:uncharacterized protein LOC103506560 [Diaphorina citri]|uniref:Uncharacterized protein LOC103506560 n=1 Tax=Diaphorina citri TaxID=121845 RepID=A0A3Q0J6Y3_DIACI|nr:uncharacterized protein LOC103506560 [Diaphorina citri]
MTKGTQLKFLLTLAHPSDGKNNHGKVKAITNTEKHTLRAVFKPKWYSNNITFPGVVDGKDRHYGEYIGFLLSLLLELYTVPVTLLRSFPMSHFLATASPRLNTTYFPGPHNTSCYMGKCLYCTRDEALIKLYAWEKFFTARVNRTRARELYYLKWRKYLDALCVYFWATTPVSMSLLTFSAYVMLGNPLTAATDMSNGRENVPISCVNYIDTDVPKTKTPALSDDKNGVQ